MQKKMPVFVRIGILFFTLLILCVVGEGHVTLGSDSTPVANITQQATNERLLTVTGLSVLLIASAAVIERQSGKDHQK